MSLQVSQPNKAFKKPKPGLRQVGGVVSNNLKTALSNLKISTNTQTGSTSGTTSTTTSTAPKTSLQKSPLAQAVSKNLTSSTKSNFFQDQTYSGYTRVDGMRTVKPSDYRRDNVEFAFGKYSSNPTGLTPRGENRQNSIIRQYIDYQREMIAKIEDQKKCMDIANMFGNISQGITGLGNLAIEYNKQKAAQKPQTETDVTVNQLRQANTSSEISQGINELNTQKQTLESSINTLTQSVNESNEIKSKNESELTEKESTLSNKEQQLTGYNSTITKLQSSISTDEAELKRLESSLSKAQDGSLTKTGLQNQVDNLKKRIESNKQELKAAEDNKKQTEEEIKTLKGEIETLRTTISNTNERLAEDTKKLDSSKEQLNEVNEAISKYTKKLDKKEDSEADKLNDMKKDLAQYAKDYAAETDSDKKAKIKEKFDKKAGEYNTIVSHSNVTGHTAITKSLGE